MLTAEHFEHILAMWKYADQLPCLVLLGDFWQLPVVDPTASRCDESQAWQGHVQTIPFREQVRCKDPKLQKKLNILRTAQPSMKQLKKLLRDHRAFILAQPLIIVTCIMRSGLPACVSCTQRYMHYNDNNNNHQS